MSKEGKLQDPAAPERNMTVYMIYLNAKRKQFLAEKPGMTLAQLQKYTNTKYSKLAASEKEVWVARAAADKLRYLDQLASYASPAGFDSKGCAIQLPWIPKPTKPKSRKRKRDTNAPKIPKTCYVLYQASVTNQVKLENPGMQIAQFGKLIAQKFKNLSPAERLTWDTRAAEDKARYEQELAAYTPPPGYNAKGALIVPRQNKHKATTDQPPVVQQTAFDFFTNQLRPALLSEYPGITASDLQTIVGERWNVLSPQEKNVHEQTAARDTIRFQEEWKQYTATGANTNATPTEPDIRLDRHQHAYYLEAAP
jgi:hypothetical protein